VYSYAFLQVNVIFKRRHKSDLLLYVRLLCYLLNASGCNHLYSENVAKIPNCCAPTFIEDYHLTTVLMSSLPKAIIFFLCNCTPSTFALEQVSRKYSVT
jgi:hypothetical protein